MNQSTALIVLLFSAVLTGFGTITYHLNSKLDETQKQVYELDKAMAVADQERISQKSKINALDKQLDKFLDEQREKRFK
ncbi:MULTISPECIES: hypothetical protein [Vibrio harveyi group]|uniref:hypothetical protein n=1 Tax=Vibrio harveyi group TaxID=717610 RepID=UPI0003FBC5EF|nr:MULTISPECIES: hypothetical protein [Vibrio harveyi group]EMA2438101.1 hypothetical protein [Vibrio parahaemolyticus]MBE3866964.1 hypothetical protein [Vibrio parahaemolyticus]MCZ5879873.1 hypothetical protein [Vibrio parahaemolyticus]MCZ6371906.1 hypothetical protein [Vibrio parahaemolyticus]MDG3049628.1 hypothetical protein [Vibrio parahaemolyticus]